jgi:mannose-6-phosphate isomerase
MLIVRGAVKDYDWGILDGLQAWSGEATGEPQAELWFGVHPGGPSPLVDSSGRPTGEHLADHFDIEAIPLLVKILAAARPLSIQVHPAKPVAEAGWLQQEQDPSMTVFSDPFEKTEMLVALGDFEAFAGWRDRRQAAAILDSVPGTAEGVAALRAGDIGAAIHLLREAFTPEAVAALPTGARAAGLPDVEVAAYATVAKMYPDDAGALLSPLLGYLSLRAGQAVYLPAGVPHSYIRGTGVEVMTSSDNVVRLGLTSKPVFVDHAINALRMDQAPQFMNTSHGDLIWPVNSPFVLRMLDTGRERIPAGAYRIVLVIEGSARVVSDLADATVRPGIAAVLSSDDPDAHVEADGLVAIVQSTER